MPEDVKTALRYNGYSCTNINLVQEFKEGDKTFFVVGRAAANDDGEGEVLFMVSNERGQPLNPEGWLKRR